MLRLTGRNQIGRIRVLQDEEVPAREVSVRDTDELLS